ncbi:MAG: hypothetical protein GY823_08725, partial [Flavobacteriaceae bacterium]|nr:hypothetical protein [Flavobacteriaceae bacterium]
MTKKKLFRLVPTTVIYLAVVVSFLSNFIDLNFYILSDIIGYSLSTNVVILYFLKQLKYCVHTRIAVCNLIALNVFNLLNSYSIIDYDTYYLTYDL